MSLLMDALRRAEADKKAQEERAARAAESGGAEEGGAITRISPFAKSEDDTVQIDGRALQAAAAAHDGMTDLDLRLDDADAGAAETPGLSLEPLEREAPAGADYLADIDGTVAEPEHSGYTTHAGRIERREGTGTLPSPRGIRQDVNDYFDRSHSMEIPRVAPRPSDGTLEDVVAHTVVGAQTVFRAGERPRYARVAVIAAAIAVYAVLAIVGVGVYYASLAPKPRPVPSPDVAAGVEKPPGTPRVVLPLDAPPAAPAAPAELARIAITPPPGDAPAASVAPPTSPAPSVEPAEPAAAAPLAAREPPPAPRATTPRPAPPAAAMSRPSIHDEEIDAGQVRISRSRTPNALDALLAQAYAALQHGDVEGAATLYNRARVLEPGRRDTLLGLAAVAQRRGDRNRAAEFYAEALKRNPDDPVASAALLSLTRSEGDAGAARLRLLLDRHGDAAYLHAALGQWYARAARWADAQQAYFDAARLDAANPDYAFNLAVSLDRLGQRGAALDYYRKSLALRAARPAAFDPQAVETRIAALGGAASP